MKVKLGPLATIFHDPSIGLTVNKDEVVTLTSLQAACYKVMKALRAGHLVQVSDDEAKKAKVEEPEAAPKEEKSINIDELVAQLESLKEANKPIKEITKAFSKEEVDALAKHYDIQVEADDTKKSIMEAILAPAE